MAKKAILVFFNGRSNAGGAERMVGYLEDYFVSRGLSTEIVDEKRLQRTWLGSLYWKLFTIRHFAKRKPIYMARFASVYCWWRLRPNQYWVSNGESTPFFPVNLVISQGCYHVMERAYGRKEQALSRMAKLQQKGLLRAKWVIAVTEQVKRNLIKYYGLSPSAISIVANRVDTSFFTPLERKPTSLYTVLYAGRLEEGKGLSLLLTLATAIEGSSRWRLLIACNNSFNTELFTSFSHTGIRIGLELHNINAEAYSLSDVVIFPSLFESFGMVTIEALAAGVPVLATPVGIIPDLAAENYPGIYVLKTTNGDEILSLLDEIVTDFAGVNKQDLHQQIESRFGIESYRNQLDDVIGKQLVS